MPFLKNEERIPVWQGQYDKIVNVLKTEDLIRIADRQATVLDS